MDTNTIAARLKSKGWSSYVVKSDCIVSTNSGKRRNASAIAQLTGASESDVTQFLSENAGQKVSATTSTKSTQGTDKMSKTSQLVAINKDSAKQAATIKVGKEVIANAKELLKPRVPMLMRGYLESPFADIFIANALVVAQKQFKPDSETLGNLAEASVTAAMLNVADQFDFKDFLSKLTKGIDTSALKSKATKDEDGEDAE